MTDTNPDPTVPEPATPDAPSEQKRTRRPRTGIPAGDRKELKLAISGDVADRLRAAADERLLSVHVLGEKAIEDFLDRLIPLDELRLTKDD